MEDETRIYREEDLLMMEALADIRFNATEIIRILDDESEEEEDA